MTTKFKDYLAVRKVHDTPAGDFTLDARSDEKLPDVKSWDELSRYLRNTQRAGRECVLAAAQVWAGYKAWLRTRR